MRVETILVQDRSARADDLGGALLADLFDATRAYARLSQTAAPAFERNACHADGALIVLNAERVLAQDPTAPDAAAQVPGVGTPNPDAMCEDMPAEETLAATAPHGCKPDTHKTAHAGAALQHEQWRAAERVRIAYFIVCSDRSDVRADELGTCAERLRGTCAARGCTWGGMLFIGEAADLARRFDTARMGLWRRRTSEATDRLIAAIRSGVSVEECQLRAGAPTPIDPASAIDVRRPFPRWIPHALLGLKRH